MRATLWAITRSSTTVAVRSDPALRRPRRPGANDRTSRTSPTRAATAPAAAVSAMGALAALSSAVAPSCGATSSAGCPRAASTASVPSQAKSRISTTARTIAEPERDECVSRRRMRGYSDPAVVVGVVTTPSFVLGGRRP
ncbi:hypothetical protein Q0F99_07260 [Rathayibacter oskolensis]|uniref:hypothetical protein n=1 Tax=Rathayibacter oskolensis TaxID=1891671 RepID=UPI00265E6A09|nr:hypothetical protein [Rathayibacter oskolensis]WKK72711.1 hypothetical protein Q0F99_07260 [Rathayibacter oskolensis]